MESFISKEAVDTYVVPGRYELPPVDGVRYYGFVDPSGGSADSMTLAIAHKDSAGRAILDCVRERKPPFSPEDVVQEFADVLKAYRVHTVQGDRFGGEWPRERFRVHRIQYDPCKQPKSDLYRELLPAINAGTVELLDIPRLVAQLLSLERRTARGGRDSIDHAPGGHDDLANVLAGAVAALPLAVSDWQPELGLSRRAASLEWALRVGAESGNPSPFASDHDRGPWQ